MVLCIYFYSIACNSLNPKQCSYISCFITTWLSSKYTVEPTASVVMNLQMPIRIYICLYLLSTAENTINAQPILYQWFQLVRLASFRSELALPASAWPRRYTPYIYRHCVGGNHWWLGSPWFWRPPFQLWVPVGNYNFHLHWDFQSLPNSVTVL
jgi:hypothetical protein